MNSIADFFQSLFSPVVNLLGVALKYFHYDLGAPWWLSIVLMTVVVRSLLFPLTVKQVKSMRAMQDLKPEMDKIRGQYKDNRQRQQEEIMKLYQERKVNPLGGCLPILVQMPIFIGIFYVIRQFGGYTAGGKTVPPTQPSFHDGGLLWFQDLSQMDSYFILPVLSALTMLAATEITSKNMEPQMRWMMRILPIGVTIFLWSFPAGLFVYWITSNLVTLGQNYLIYHHGPGKKASPTTSASSEPSKKPRLSTASVSEDGGSDGYRSSERGVDDPVERAAKAAKRKRRKKKR